MPFFSFCSLTADQLSQLRGALTTALELEETRAPLNHQVLRVQLEAVGELLAAVGIAAERLLGLVQAPELEAHQPTLMEAAAVIQQAAKACLEQAGELPAALASLGELDRALAEVLAHAIELSKGRHG